jgi:hypothetical protein
MLLQGPLSPQSTLHAAAASNSLIPTAADVMSQTGVMGIEGIAVLPADHPILVQPLTVLGPVQQVGLFLILGMFILSAH